MAMARLKVWGAGRETALGRFLAAAAWTGVSMIAAVLAIAFAATLVVVAVAACAFLAVAVVLRGRRVKASDPDLIEARHIGGHSWVAYGWDGRS
ncbi:MAG TPA: hypothetical protein VIB82_06150 [Caulobacteraceae bacterium]